MRSKFERDIASLLKANSFKFKYEPHGLAYTVRRTYYPDFLIGGIYIEAKGFFKPSDRTKMLKIKELYPELDIRFWFQQDNWTTKAKILRYSDWAIKHGFPYHVGPSFPSHWFSKDKADKPIKRKRKLLTKGKKSDTMRNNNG